MAEEDKIAALYKADSGIDSLLFLIYSQERMVDLSPGYPVINL